MSVVVITAYTKSTGTCCWQATSDLAGGSVFLALSTVFHQKGIRGLVNSIRILTVSYITLH